MKKELTIPISHNLLLVLANFSRLKYNHTAYKVENFREAQGVPLYMVPITHIYKVLRFFLFGS